MKSTATLQGVRLMLLTEFAPGGRVFHQKFGMGNITHIDGDKLEIAFDRAGSKKACKRESMVVYMRKPSR